MDIALEYLGKYATEIIALCAIGFTVWNVVIQRKHNVLSVAPHLTTSSSAKLTNDTGKVELVLMNNGLGPAYIETFMTYQNRKSCDFQQALESVNVEFKKAEGYDKNKNHAEGAVLYKGYAIKSGESFNIFRFEFPCLNHEHLMAAKENLSSLDIAIEYKCAYGKLKKFDTFKD